jgi:uncharacterized membrane protein
MLSVRYLVLAALAVWVGGMVVLGLVVAPSAFRVLQGTVPENGRVLGGAVFGEVLRQFHLIAYACGGIIVLGLFVMKFVGPPPAFFEIRAGLAALMLGIALYSGLIISTRMTQLQQSVPGSLSALSETDARRVRFDALHRRSTALMTINVGLGLVSLFWYVRRE